MILYEIEKSDIRKYGSVKKAIAAGCYIPRNDEFIKRAFNLGHGTVNDMNRYMKDNSCFCVWIDAETMQQVARL